MAQYRTVSRLFLLVGLVVVLIPHAHITAQIANGGKKILILSGGQRNHHAYRDQTHYLQRLLEQTGKFEVTIVEDAAILATDALNKYDAIIAMADRRDPEHRLTRQQQEALLKFVRNGKGFVSIHGFCCAQRDWVQGMRELLGGVLAHFGKPDTRVRWGDYVVHIAKEHPVVRGLTDFKLRDELYYYLQTTGDLDAVATVEYEGKHWPVAWVRKYGNGRVFVTTLGHKSLRRQQEDPLQHPSLSRMIVQAVEWVTGERDGEPAGR